MRLPNGIKKAVTTGAIIIIDDKDDYEGCRFRIRNGKVQYSARFADLHYRGEWFNHPEFTKTSLIKHLQNLAKKDFVIHI